MKTATLKLTYGEAVLYQGVKLMNGSRYVGTGGHMVVEEHYKGNSPKRVLVLEENGKLKVKGLLSMSTLQSPSGAMEFSVDLGNEVRELSADEEQKFLKIYQMFQNAKSPE